MKTVHHSEGNIYEVFKLTVTQQKCFNRLKKSVKDCLDSGIFFVQILDSLYALDKNLVKDYINEEMAKRYSGFGVNLKGHLLADSVKTTDSFADDAHTVILTKKGEKVFYDGCDD